jgi:hypothetical protein
METHPDMEIDLDALTEEVEENALDQSYYPMSAGIRFSVRLDEGVVDMYVAVKDGTSNEDAAWYAGEAIKVLNDAVAVQDITYAMAEEEYFGGLYQEAEINMNLYYESEFPDGEPFFQATVEPDAYEVFVIN